MAKLAYNAKKFENFLKKNFGGFHYETTTVDKENTRVYRLHFGSPEKFQYTEFWNKGGSGGDSFIEDLVIDGKPFSFEENNIDTIEKLVAYFCSTYDLQDSYAKASRAPKSEIAPLNPEAIPATATKNLVTLKIAAEKIGMDAVKSGIDSSDIPLNPLTLQVIINSAVSKKLIEDSDYYAYLDQIKAENEVIVKNVSKFSELKTLPLSDYKDAITLLNEKNLW